MTGEVPDPHEVVRSTYAEIAKDPSAAGCCPPEGIDDAEQLEAVPEGAELGLGTGRPVEAAQPGLGQTVVDLGSGAGVDVFLAAEAVGPEGRAIGIDVTPEMVERARKLAKANGVENVEFRNASIEDLPLPDGLADVVISNCVINLSPDKPAVLEEAFRVLAPGGRFVVSDTLDVGGSGKAASSASGCGCVSGALTASAWRSLLAGAGFTGISLDVEPPDGRFGPAVGTALVRARKPVDAES